jgi:hypothetical protein
VSCRFSHCAARCTLREQRCHGLAAADLAVSFPARIRDERLMCYDPDLVVLCRLMIPLNYWIEAKNEGSDQAIG